MSIKKSKVTRKGNPVQRAPQKGGAKKAIVKGAQVIAELGIDMLPGGPVAKKLLKGGVQVAKSLKGKSAENGKKRRRGVVPKTVRKWSNRMTRRRKQEEKIVKKLFGAEGGKIVKKPKISRYGSPGVITQQEVREAMRR